MPKLLYKCDYCTDTYKEENEAVEHERECDFNPSTKKCGTCLYYVPDYGNFVCKISDKGTYKYCDERKTCPFWEVEDCL